MSSYVRYSVFDQPVPENVSVGTLFQGINIIPA